MFKSSKIELNKPPIQSQDFILLEEVENLNSWLSVIAYIDLLLPLSSINLGKKWPNLTIYARDGPVGAVNRSPKCRTPKPAKPSKEETRSPRSSLSSQMILDNFLPFVKAWTYFVFSSPQVNNRAQIFKRQATSFSPKIFLHLSSQEKTSSFVSWSRNPNPGLLRIWSRKFS